MNEATLAAIVLSPNAEVQDRARELAVLLHEKYGVGDPASAQPPHVSLKQPFRVHDLARFEAYFDRFAGSIVAPPVNLERLQVWYPPNQDTGIATLAVSDGLRGLHDRLNRELPEALGHPTPADFDGDAYQFHLTIAFQGAEAETYRRLERDHTGQALNWPCSFVGIEAYVGGLTESGWVFASFKYLAL